MQGSISHPSDLLYSDVLVLFRGQPPCQTAYKKTILPSFKALKRDIRGFEFEIQEISIFLRKIVIVILKLYRIGLREKIAATN